MKAVAILLFIGLSPAFAFSAVSKTASTSASNSNSKKNYVSELLPNTVAFDITENNTIVELDSRQSLSARKQPIGQSLGQASRLIDSLTFTTLQPPSELNFKLRLRWVTSFSFAFHNLLFESPAVFLSDTDFQIFRTSFGVGPELSFDTPAGTLYTSVAPGVAYSWVSWSSPVSGGSMGQSNLNISATAGIYRYFGSNWAGRLFYRAVFEDTQVWNEAMDSSQGFDVPVGRVYNSIVGLSISYTF